MTAGPVKAAPSPPALPKLGHLPWLARDVLGFFTRSVREHGDVVRLQLGDFPVFVLSNPADIEFVHAQSGRLFDKGLAGDVVLDALIGNGLLTSEREFWLRQRRLAQPAFHHRRVNAYGETMVDLALEARAAWRSGEVRDLHADMMHLTLGIVTKTLLNAEPHGEGSRMIGDALDVVLREYEYLLRSPLKVLPGALARSRRRVEEAVSGLDAVIQGIIDERAASGRDEGDLLSMLLAARDDEGGAMIGRQLHDEVKTLILAGHETTANTLSWTFLLLASHPSAESRLHAELDDVLAGAPPTLADLPRLPFTAAVIKESMRLFPPAWAVRRRAREAWTASGVDLPAGATITMSQYVVHRDPRWWDAPDDFRPERWLAPDFERSLPRYAYFPFGGGPRLCIGQAFAQMEAGLLLATLAPGWRVRLAGPVAPEASITLRPRGGLPVRLHARR